MEITHKIKMDLIHRGTAPRIALVQGDAYTRRLAISLFVDRRPWKIPSDATVLVRYRKPNRASGAYDTLADGTQAVTVSGNCVSLLLAPEALTVPGIVTVLITIVQGDRRLSTFGIELAVQSDCSTDLTEEAGTAWIAAFLPAPAAAAVGQYFAVETVDDTGRVLSLKAVDAPTGSSEEIRAAVEECLQDLDLGSDGISVTHTWDGTVLTVTSASGTSSADLKGEQGEKGDQGEPGADGSDGLTPHIGSNGNWWIGLTDTNVSAAGSTASITVDSQLDTTSENPVQNKVVASYILTIESAIENGVFPRLLPSVTADDDGKFLQVADGAWTAVAMQNAEEVSF